MGADQKLRAGEGAATTSMCAFLRVAVAQFKKGRQLSHSKKGDNNLSYASQLASAKSGKANYKAAHTEALARS